MRWIIFSDLHYKNTDRLRPEEFKSVINLINSYISKNEVDGIIILGDIVDRASRVKLQILESFLHSIIYSKKPWLLITGNHDYIGKGKDLASFVSISMLLPNVYTGKDIVDKFPQFSVWNYYDTEPIGTGKILLSHKDIIDFNPFYDNEYAISLSELRKYDTVISGHIHTHKKINNVLLLGPPYPTSWGDVRNGVRGAYALFDDEQNKCIIKATNISFWAEVDSSDELEEIMSTPIVRQHSFFHVKSSDPSIVELPLDWNIDVTLDITKKDDLLLSDKSSETMITFDDVVKVGVDGGIIGEYEAKIIKAAFQASTKHSV